MPSGVYKRKAKDPNSREKSILKYSKTEKYVMTQKRYKEKIKNNANKSVKLYLRNQRMAALEILGGICCRCSFADYRALQIDHINGGGSKERKERNYKGSFHKNVINSVLNNENKYQLLCANCNWIKRYENNENKINNQ